MGRAVMQSSTYLYQNRGLHGAELLTRDSIDCMVSSLSTTDTGEPMGRPEI